LLNGVLPAEWQIRYAGANRTIAARQVPDIAFSYLNTASVLAGDTQRFGVDVHAPGMPACFCSLNEYRARSAAGVQKNPVGLPGKPDHGSCNRRAQGSTSLNIAAVMLAHTGVGDAQTGDDLAWFVLDHPDLDVGWIGKAPVGLMPLDCIGEIAPKIGPQERPLLQDSRDHAERSPFSGSASHPGARRQRSSCSLWSPQPASDPLRPVTVRPQRTTDLNEEVLSQPGCGYLLKR
jgi:hypothetical protein